MITNIKDVLYDKKYFWDLSYNPNATIANALPNCTTLAYGMIIAEGKKPPLNRIPSASAWEACLINGWSYIPYDDNRLEVGDILQWKRKNHVAVVSRIVEDKVIISASAYTGEHGVSMYNGSYDTRNSFSSLKDLSDFMYEKYPSRYFHCWSIEDEIKFVGGIPDNILKHPLYSVEKNINRNQIEVLTSEQNVRNSNDKILKKAEQGYYNVLSQKEANGYIWYEVEPDMYIAGVQGRVIYHQANNEYEYLIKENEELKRRLKEIGGLANYE